MQTTILWVGPIDDVSRRLLTEALLRAAYGGCPVRLPAFAAAARDLFRHMSRTFAAHHKGRARRRCFAHPASDRLPDNFIAEAARLHDDLLAATRGLRNHAPLRPRVAIVKGAEADGSLQQALSALQELLADLGDYVEQVLRRLTLAVNRNAFCAIILETRREVDELAACRAEGDVYVEGLTVTESGDRAVNFEVESVLGSVVQ